MGSVVNRAGLDTDEGGGEDVSQGRRHKTREKTLHKGGDLKTMGEDVRRGGSHEPGGEASAKGGRHKTRGKT